MKWLEIAKTLPLGAKTTTTCPDCGKEDKLSVNHAHKEYWCNCFRCGWSDDQSKGQLTLAERKELQELNEAAVNAKLKVELPEDFSEDIPIEGRLWLYGASITESIRRRYGIGYSKQYRRVVLPVKDSKGNLSWFQMRAVHEGQLPKYIQPADGRESIVFDTAPHRDNTGEVVIVEDILSAIRIGETTRCISLLGTKLSTEQAATLSKFKQVIVWLDSDKAGRKGAYSIRKQLGLVTEVKNIVTDADPKKLTNKQIKETLCSITE